MPAAIKKDTAGHFLDCWDYFPELTAGLPYPTPEYKFHPTRKWRFDWCFERASVAVEVEGGLWVNGRHNRPAGYAADIEKYNAAAAMGWRVFRCTPGMLAADPESFVQMVAEAVQRGLTHG